MTNLVDDLREVREALVDALESLHNRALKEMPDYEITEDYYLTLAALNKAKGA